MSDGIGNFAEIACAFGWNDNGLGRGCFGLRSGNPGLKFNASFRMDGIDDGMIKGCDPIVIEFGRDGAKNGHIQRLPIKCFAVALYLFANIPHGIFPAAFFKFVDHHQVGEVKHINFFKLGGGTELTGHHINGDVDQIGNARIPLPDAGGLGNNQIKTGRF